MRGDTSPHNTPEKVLSNIRTTHIRMSRADQVLGIRRLTKFCNAVSRILYHIEPSLDGLNSTHGVIGHGADITTLLISAAMELESAWNVLRLANIPSARRQGRVASEFIAIVVLLCIPRNKLVELPKRKAPISYALRQNPSKSVFDLYEPIPVDPTDERKLKPILLATKFFTSFLYVAEYLLKIPSQTIQSFRNYREYVQHPASHGSSDVVWHYFEGFNARTKLAGAYLSKKRYPGIRFEGDQLIALAELLADILDWTTYEYLKKTEDA